MGIRDRDSVESQPEEALVKTPEPVAETVIAGEPAAVVDTAVAADAAPAVTTAVAESSEVLPMPVFTAPVAEAFPAAVGVAQPEPSPAPVGTLDARGPLEPATPSTQASLGLSAVALGGLLAMWYEGRRKNDRKSDEDNAA